MSNPRLPSLSVCCLILLCCLPADAPSFSVIDDSRRSFEYWLKVYKEQRVVLLMNPYTGEPLHSYTASFGGGAPGKKRLRGDIRTPEGTYWITEMRSSGRYHFFLQLNYPNRMDAWRGLFSGHISPEQYRDIMQAHREDRLPPQNTRLGGQIGLHGLGPGSSPPPADLELFNWTKGCIALSNQAIEELGDYLEVGSRVVIYP